MYYAVILSVNSELELLEISGLFKGTAIKVVSGGGAGVCLCWAEVEGEGGGGRRRGGGVFSLVN